LRTVRESIEDKQTGDFIRKAIFEEIIPTLDLSLSELTRFANDTIERFQNPSIRHELQTIALNSISKFKVRVLPSVLEYLNRKKELPGHLLYSLAALICFYKGTWNDETIPLNDAPEVLATMKEAWNDSSTVAEKTLSNVSFWDQDLTQLRGITEKVSGYVQELVAEEKMKLINK
jgi:tagaturonate reductase